MLQYLLNATAIWLISLLSFDLFLRRENYHAYNRFYLLFTFLLGALLPLWQWQGNGGLGYTSLEQPVEKVIAIKKTLASADVSHGELNIGTWLTVIYGAGVFIALAMLIAEIVKIVVYYRTGKKSREDTWTIVETGKEYAPFSFVNILFISAREQYKPDEWRMITAHERRHAILIHVADVVMLQLAKIIFWFHPLVYLYNRRLLLVHEYQADSVSATHLQVYGKFLLEQALLPVAPAITHSFNRSPIKKRIIMLTRKSSVLAKSKMLVFLPVAAICLFCFSKNAFSQRFERKGNIVTYHGNKFEMSELQRDTITVIDPVNGQEITKVAEKAPRPLKMNGRPIPTTVDQAPVYTGSERDLRDYLVKNMKYELSKLGDGDYRLFISEILIDEHGKIVYFNYENMRRSKTRDEIKNDKEVVQVVNVSDPMNKNGKTMTLQRNTNRANFEEIDSRLQQEIFNKVCELMETAPGFKPGKLKGKNVVSEYDCLRFYNHFKVANHKLYDMNEKGQYEEVK